MQKNEQYRKIRKKGKIMKNREKEGKKYEQQRKRRNNIMNNNFKKEK